MRSIDYMRKSIYLFLLLIILSSCRETNKDRLTRLVKEWDGKEIVFPESIVFTRYGVDTLEYRLPRSEYTIISYIDSVGCTSCKLQFYRWQHIMHEMDSVSGQLIPYLFVFHPKNKRDFSELSYLMKRDKFDTPVWIDVDDTFNKQNKLPSESILHTFLVDRQNKVVALGNPFQNPQIRELYLSVLNGKGTHEKSTTLTKAFVEEPVIDMGEFDWKIPQTIDFKLINQGDKPMVINDVVTSCGCISVNYSKHPIEPGKNALVTAIYKAEKPEFFIKKLIVYANTQSTLQLTVKGSAK